ncbi:MAG: IS1595 family transposase [Candidatus Marinimicrobia bacterium]|nr:IS1595 family transposase [Candidatus Neomarinimicrobiota bacterium]
MKKQLKCLRCGCQKLYSVRREKKRCSSCGYEWRSGRLPLHLTRKEWSKILHWFLRGLPAVAIAQETGLHRQRILRALMHVRAAMQKDIPEIFSGIVEVDETYIGGQCLPAVGTQAGKNKRKKERAKGTKRGRGTSKTPVFGILCRGGKVWAQVVPDVEAKTLLPLISRRVEVGSTVCSDTWKSYTGIAAKGYVHRLVKHHAGEYSDGKGNHINGLVPTCRDGGI